MAKKVISLLLVCSVLKLQCRELWLVGLVNMTWRKQLL